MQLNTLTTFVMFLSWKVINAFLALIALEHQNVHCLHTFLATSWEWDNYKDLLTEVKNFCFVTE